MTEYPVLCFNNNREPYGSYCNPYSDSGSVFLAEYLAFEHENERREHLPFPSGTIGKTYERDEVEVVTLDAKTARSIAPIIGIDHRIMPLKGDFTYFQLAQPVEKEPETVDNDLYFEVAEIAQHNLIIQDPKRFVHPILKAPWEEKAKKKYHDQVQFDALQFIRDLKNKGYKITKQ